MGFNGFIGSFYQVFPMNYAQKAQAIKDQRLAEEKASRRAAAERQAEREKELDAIRKKCRAGLNKLKPYFKEFDGFKTSHGPLEFTESKEDGFGELCLGQGQGEWLKPFLLVSYYEYKGEGEYRLYGQDYNRYSLGRFETIERTMEAVAAHVAKL